MVSQLGCVASNALSESNEVTIGMGFGVEFLLTFFLLFVVNAASDSSKSNSVRSCCSARLLFKQL